MTHVKIPSYQDAEIAIHNERKTGESATALEKFVHEYEHTMDSEWRPMLAAVLADMMPAGATVEW